MFSFLHIWAVLLAIFKNGEYKCWTWLSFNYIFDNQNIIRHLFQYHDGFNIFKHAILKVLIGNTKFGRCFNYCLGFCIWNFGFLKPTYILLDHTCYYYLLKLLKYNQFVKKNGIYWTFNSHDRSTESRRIKIFNGFCLAIYYVFDNWKLQHFKVNL